MSEKELKELWDKAKFSPNEEQRKAILHVDGPLYLPAGPGSGKTRVLLWRTVNLIVFHDVRPDQVFLATFTEKAALQLKEGLRAYLGMAGNATGRSYDTGQIYLGTAHSLCQRMLTDRRFYAGRSRPHAPVLLDELDQFFHVYESFRWDELTENLLWNASANEDINWFIDQKNSSSRVNAAKNALAFFNRLAEECVDPNELRQRVSDPSFTALLEMCARYRASLRQTEQSNMTDFALLQQSALDVLNANEAAGQVFKHVIVDEYQDTNAIQERIYFKLAQGHKNLCVVGDDDQALYRFRGATVENLVQFPERCAEKLGVAPTIIPLSTNYRSRADIVSYYSRFIEDHDWSRPSQPGGAYRVTDKNIRAHSKDSSPAVFATNRVNISQAQEQIADVVHRLITTKRVEDPSQIAFLYPALKNKKGVQSMMRALEDRGLRVYAPRAGSFLEVEEARDVFGVFLKIFGKPDLRQLQGQTAQPYVTWLDAIDARAADLLNADPALDQFIKDRQQQIATAVSDYDEFVKCAERNGWDLKSPYNQSRMARVFLALPRVSDAGKRLFGSPSFGKVIQKRFDAGNPFELQYVLNMATSLDWNALDLLYHLCGFGHFKRMIDLAEKGEDEGPICNLALISQYLSRFLDSKNAGTITASRLKDGRMGQLLFGSFLYVLFRLGESEYEDAEDPFPKGRIPFLTIHQSKGLEFPVVVLGNPRHKNQTQRLDELMFPFLERSARGEPLDRMSGFDNRRLFYVALSRAKNALIVANFRGPGYADKDVVAPQMINNLPTLSTLSEHLDEIPAESYKRDNLPRAYSYTADYLLYEKCPRQYMVFRRYGFVPSRSQTMMFGSLVHRTLDDLHQHLIGLRGEQS